MGKRGPAPKPVDELKMRGTFRAHRHAEREKETTKALDRVPSPPARLGPVAREVWRQTARRLVARKLLASLDLSALESYALATERARAAEAVVAEEGRTITTPQGKKRHPELVTAEKARAEMRTYEGKFYMTPADRLRAPLPEVDDDRHDATERMLFGDPHQYFNGPAVARQNKRRGA